MKNARALGKHGKTDAQRAAKRWRRELRNKSGWYCWRCKQRHAEGSRCPIPRRSA